MSDSPKYCAARLRERQERRLRKKREQQAALERVQRKAEEERRSGSRLEQSRKTIATDLADIQKAISAFADSDSAGYVQADRLEILRNELRNLAPLVKETTDEERLRTVNGDLRKIREDLHSVIAQAEADKLCDDLAEEEAEVVKLEKQLVALDQARSAKFDPAGLHDLTEFIRSARSHLQQKALLQVRREATAAQQKLDRHRADVASRFITWQTSKDRAEIALAAASDLLGGFRADEVVVRWMSSEIADLERRLEKATNFAASEQFNGAESECAELMKAGETVLASAQDRQLKEDRRQYIVQGIVEVMGQMGFVVQQGSPALEHPNVPSSATRIHAERVGGGAIAVSVPQEGEIWYDVAGFPMREEASADGKTVRSCDEAEQQIVRMHEALQETFGIEMGELLWDSKDPDRVRKTAERLPESTPAARVRGE